MSHLRVIRFWGKISLMTRRNLITLMDMKTNNEVEDFAFLHVYSIDTEVELSGRVENAASKCSRTGAVEWQ